MSWGFSTLTAFRLTRPWWTMLWPTARKQSPLLALHKQVTTSHQNPTSLLPLPSSSCGKTLGLLCKIQPSRKCLTWQTLQRTSVTPLRWQVFATRLCSQPTTPKMQTKARGICTPTVSTVSVLTLRAACSTSTKPG